MYRSIDTKFWTDPKIRRLTPHEKYLFLYFITTGHTHVSGIYTLPKVLIQHETGLSLSEVSDGIDTLSRAYLVSYDTETETIWVRHMLRYQHHGEKIRLAVAAQLGSLHNSPLIQEFMNEYADIDIPYQYPIDTRARVIQEQEQEQEQEPDLKPMNHTSAAKRKSKEVDTNYTTGFLAWWEEYPSGRKVSKPVCFAVWKDKHLEERTAELVGKLVRLKETTWKHAEPCYIKSSLPYLNDHRYEDDLVPLPRYPTQADSGMNEREYRTVMTAHSLAEEIQREGRRQQSFLSVPGGDGPDVL